MMSLVKKRSEKVFIYFNVTFALGIIAMYLNALLFPNMGLDASFYLRVTEYIAEGAIPEYDLRILYPPLIFYMFLPIRLIAGVSVAYEFFLGFMFLIQLVNAVLIFKISGSYITNQSVKIFAGLLYLFLSIKLEGEYLVLEPFVNFWGLWALWIYLRKDKPVMIKLMLSGLLVFLAFLTKQYGLGWAFLIFILILVDEYHSSRKVIKNSLYFLTGLVSGLMLFVFIFRLGYGVYYDFFAGGRIGLYGEKEIYLLGRGLLKYLVIAPYLLLLIVPIIFKKLVSKTTHILAYLMITVVFSLQLYFQQYSHYYILALPGLIMILVLTVDLLNKEYAFLLLPLLLILLLVNEVFVGPNSKGMILSKQSSLNPEIQSAKRINDIIPPNTRVYVFSDVKLYYLCHFSPAMPEKYGFAWNHTTAYKELIEMLGNTTYAVVSDKDISNEFILIDTKIIINRILDQQNFRLIEKVDKYLIFKKS